MSTKPSIKTVGILGFGAFGRLIAAHLAQHFSLVVCDPALTPGKQGHSRVRIGDSADVGRCDVLILAVPVGELSAAIREIQPYLRPGSIVVDVGSVKVRPIEVMKAALPDFVEIVGTHPLFGPQSARAGIAGRKIAICPVRGRSALRIAAFLRAVLGLAVYLVSPEEHDRQAAIVQGVTHLIARVLVRMEPLPTELTTASFDHLMQATEMVRYDAASVYLAIERDNPYAAEVRERFFMLAERMRGELDEHGSASEISATPPVA
jgi:prephenate dehydrogenase